MSNRTNTAKRSFVRELTTDYSTTPRSLATSVSLFSPVLPSSIEDLSTWLRQASLVSHSAELAQCSEPTTPAICGQKPRNAFAWYDRNTHYWKTFQPSLIADISNEYSATWPRWGWMQSGECSQLAPLVRHIHGKDCSYWLTPNASDAKRGRMNMLEAQRAARREIRKSGSIVQDSTIYQFLIRFGKPCPITFYEYLMGIPIGATALKPLETDGFLLWLRQHGIP